MIRKRLDRPALSASIIRQCCTICFFFYVEICELDEIYASIKFRSKLKENENKHHLPLAYITFRTFPFQIFSWRAIRESVEECEIAFAAAGMLIM